MVAAMALFAVEDALIKQVSVQLPVSETLVGFGLGGAFVFAWVARLQGRALYSPAALSGVMRLRMGFEIGGRLFYVLALALTPLSSATAILQATPLVVVLGAAVFLGERVGIARWLAIGVGLLGVVCVVRPGADSFSALSLLAVAGMVGFAGRDLASRAAPVSLGTAVLGLYGFIAVAIAGGLYAGVEQRAWQWPATDTAIWLLAAIAVGAGAYASLMKAMRTGDVSAVTPFRYTRLVFGIALGVLVFGEQIDGVTWLGCALIVVAGLVSLQSGKRASGPRAAR